MILYVIGFILAAEGALLLLPAIVSLIYLESAIWSFLITAAVCGALGAVLLLTCRPADTSMYSREGFVIVALGWILMSALGAVPFVISGDIPNYIDAFFETVSGFTTTGASILNDVETLSRGGLFWRSFTHWIGGMGVLIFIMAIIPNLSDKPVHIMKAEMPGPVFGKLVPRANDTAKILYIIYIALTGLEFLFLLFGGLPVYDSLVTAIGTAGTGGFAITNSSIGGYSPYIQWVVTVFMTLFGVNFNLYYLILVRQFRSAVSSFELRVYLLILATVTCVITVNILGTCSSPGEAFRLAAFQSASIMSTTGFSTADFNAWPGLSRGILMVLMFFGACAGSTAGGFKLSRVIILFKAMRREIRKLLHPRSVSTVTFEGKPVEEATISSISNYLAVYAACLLGIFLLLCLDPSAGFEENFSASVACFNNIGPGFGGIGPTSSYSAYSVFSKLLLSLGMLAGRLEIYPILITLIPSTWTRR
jgi:trk system potassium uptake protein TrkH